MTRTMYDAVTAANIPRSATMVAGYIDQIVIPPWQPSDWALFPAAVKVTIVKKATTNAGHVLDVEPGDATSAEAPGWVRLRRAAGADPTVYCNASTWSTARAAFAAAGVAEPHWWIAQYDGDPTIPVGAVAKQYRGNVAPGIDVSSVVDYWPGVDPAPSNSGGAASTTGVELMERKVIPASPNTVAVRLFLSGSPGAAIIIRPRIGGDGFATNPVFLGNIYAWGNDHVGIGHNPKTDGTTDFRLESHRRIDLPGAVWADFEYSCNSDFDLDIVG